MALTVPTTVFPSERRSLGYAKEVTPGVPVLPTSTIPVKGFIPEDKPIFLPDESLRSAMASNYGMIEGPSYGDFTFDASPVYGDTIGAQLLNLLGDYTVTGTAATPTWTTSGSLSPGAGPIPVVTGSAAVAGTFIQVDVAPNAEVVTVDSASTTTSIVISAATPLRFPHASGVDVITVVAPFTHVFSLLNGTGNCQPPTHTFADMNFIPANKARLFPYSCFSEIVLTGNAEGFFTWSGKAMGFRSQLPVSVPTVNVSTVPAEPAWNSTVGIGGPISTSQIYDIGEWEITISRECQAFYTANGQQSPYIIGRGKCSAAGKINFSPTIDESPLTYLLSNAQPQLQILQQNPATSGTNTLQIDVNTCVFTAAVIEPSKALLGYANNFEATANTTNAGQSAGYSPLKVTVVNGIPSY